MENRAINFVNEFTTADFRARKAKWTERDDMAFNKILSGLNNYYSSDLRSDIVRPIPLDDKTFEEGKKYLDSIQQSAFYILQVFKDEKFSAFLGSFFKGGDGFFLKVYFKAIDGIYKIISQYSICHTCEGSGKNKGRKCSECDGEGWLFEEGQKQQSHEIRLETRKFSRPGNPAHALLFDSI